MPWGYSYWYANVPYISVESGLADTSTGYQVLFCFVRKCEDRLEFIRLLKRSLLLRGICYGCGQIGVLYRKRPPSDFFCPRHYWVVACLMSFSTPTRRHAGGGTP